MARRCKLTKGVFERIVTMVKSDTFTLNEICEQNGISIRTYYDWRERYPEFDQAIIDAEDARMQDLVLVAKKSLRRKVEGYMIDETTVVTVPSKEKDANGKPKPIIKEQKTVHRHVAPDAAAIIFTLTNGDPDNWRNKQTNEIVGKDGKDLFKSMSDDEIESKIKELERRNGIK